MAEVGRQMKVTVITDTTATLPRDVAERLGIVVVPIRVTVGDRSYRDGEISHRQLLEATERVTTSGPSPQEFLEVIEAHGSAAGVLILTLAHDLGSSTFMSAQAAAAVSSVPVTVVDTATAAGSQGLVALAAARRAAAGGILEEVEVEARHVIGRVRLLANLPNLDHLARSGHVPGAAAWAARWIGLNVVVDLRGGRVRPAKAVLSERAAIDYMVETWKKSRPSQPSRLHLAVLHSVDPGPAEQILQRVRAEVEPEEVFVGSMGTTMVVHSGPGVSGLGWWWEDAEA